MRLGGTDEPDGGAGAGTEMHAGRRAAGPAELDGIRRHRLVHGDVLGRLLGAPPFLGRADRARGRPGRRCPPPWRASRTSCAASGYPIGVAMAKRSSWLSTSGKVPRCECGFWVAMTRWGCGNGQDWPSTLTWRSSIVSRSADCVRGGVRLSSSTSTTWAKTGPGPEVPGAGVGHEDRHARDVGRQQVGVTLDPRQLGAEGGGERAGQHRLAHARHVLNEEMAAREGGDGGGHQCGPAAEHDLLEVAHQRLAERDGVVQIADALVDDAHRVTALPWAMGAKTTGVGPDLGPHRHGRRPHGVPPGREAATARPP